MHSSFFLTGLNWVVVEFENSIMTRTCSMNLERILLRKPHGNTLCFLCFPQMRRIVAQGCIQEHHIYSNLLIRDCFFRPTNEVLLVRLSWRNRYIAYGIITISKFQMRIYPNGVNRRRSFIALN